MNIQDEQYLLRALQQGSSQALELLYREHYEGVYAYCVKILLDRHVAKDIVQDTFLKAGQCASTLRLSESFRSWLFRIARNEALMHLRKNRRNGRLDEDSRWNDETPHDLTIAQERSELVNTLLGQLKYEYREVLVLRAYENLSYAEIAAITESTESSVKSRIFKARKALADKVRRYYP
ncbi:MAG: RNA polymerase sigma factor [bacterium]